MTSNYQSYKSNTIPNTNINLLSTTYDPTKTPKNIIQNNNIQQTNNNITTL